MQLLLFTDKNADDMQRGLYAIFKEDGLHPMIDAEHGQDFDWLQEKTQNTPHMFFSLQRSDTDYWFYACDFEILKMDEIIPNFMVYFNSTDVLRPGDWDFIHRYMEGIILGKDLPRVSRRQKQLLGGVVENDQVLESSEVIDGPNHYTFRQEINRERDIGIFEIYKPNTNLPYTTVVVRKFSEKGYMPVFTSCTKWGSTLADESFLRYLWEHLGMEGNFDLNVLFDEAYQSTLPYIDNDGFASFPLNEQEVYRIKLEDTIQMFKNKGF